MEFQDPSASSRLGVFALNSSCFPLADRREPLATPLVYSPHLRTIAGPQIDPRGGVWQWKACRSMAGGQRERRRV